MEIASNISSAANKTGSSIKTDPIGAMKILFFILLGILLIFVVFKVIKGLGHTAALLGDLAPTTEKEKREIVENVKYGDAIKWLDDRAGIVAIARAGFKKSTDYLLRINLNYHTLTNAADTIWNSKYPFYIDQVAIYDALASLPTKAAISLMAQYFNITYGNRWNGYPLNTFLAKYMSTAQMQTVSEIIDKKPKI